MPTDLSGPARLAVMSLAVSEHTGTLIMYQPLGCRVSIPTVPTPSECPERWGLELLAYGQGLDHSTLNPVLLPSRSPWAASCACFLLFHPDSLALTKTIM